jgi:hypothetical protein
MGEDPVQPEPPGATGKLLATFLRPSFPRRALPLFGLTARRLACAQVCPLLQNYGPPAADTAESDPEEVEDADDVEPADSERAGASEAGEAETETEGAEEAESTGESPPQTHLRDWTDDDAEAEASRVAEAPEEPEASEDEVTAPRKRQHRAGSGSSRGGSDAGDKGKRLAVAKPAPKRAATAQPGGSRGGGGKKQRVSQAGPARRAIPVVAG